MILTLIYARSENRCIGRDGDLPWRLPDDFRHFKRTTMGHPIIMGRRTFEDHNTALPGRTNIVLTSRGDFAPADVIVRRGLDDALAPYRDTDEQVFIAGGARLYAAAFPHAHRVYETVVHANVEGDTHLPPFDFTGWKDTVLEHHPADDRHTHAFTITRWDRV
jgi:dihydrofolate reductase